MKNFFAKNQSNCDVEHGKYCFVGNYFYGRRIVGVYTDRMQYGIEIGGDVVSPWFDKLFLMPNFNICRKDGKSFLTSANGKEKISDEYKYIGRFNKIYSLDRYYATVKGIDGKLGTLSSEGKGGIECSQEELIRFGKAFTVCGKKVGNELKYGIRAVNGERLTGYTYTNYRLIDGKTYLKSAEGEIVIYDSLGRLVK